MPSPRSSDTRKQFFSALAFIRCFFFLHFLFNANKNFSSYSKPRGLQFHVFKNSQRRFSTLPLGKLLEIELPSSICISGDRIGGGKRSNFVSRPIFLRRLGENRIFRDFADNDKVNFSNKSHETDFISILFHR